MLHIYERMNQEIEMTDKDRRNDQLSEVTSDESVEENGRRKFMTGAFSAMAAAPFLTSSDAFAQATPDVPSVRIPDDFTDSVEEDPVERNFEAEEGITGAEVFANLCKDEGLSALFMCPGNYTLTHAIAAAGIPSYGGRREGNMAAAADGYARATGKVAACSGTEGPGFADMIMSISAAYFANTPLLVLASNVQLSSEDSYSGIQAMYQQPLTSGIKKYGKRLILPNRVYEYGGYAFRNLKTGVPGPVHLDFPGEVTRARFQDPSGLTDYHQKEEYRSVSKPVPASGDMQEAIDMIKQAERPLIVAGHGVSMREAWDPFLRAAEKNDLAIVSSGPVRGQAPDDHRLSISMSPRALMSVDLVIMVGQYLMPTPSDWSLSPDVKVIRVHPEPEDLGRNWGLDLGLVGDERAFLEELATGLPQRERSAWVDEIASERQSYQNDLEEFYQLGVRYTNDTGAVHPAVIGKKLNEFLYHGDIDPKQTLTGWGGFTAQRFVPPMLRANRPGQEVVCPYQFGAIGPDLSMMIGAAIGVKEGVGMQSEYKGAPSLVVTTDAGMGFSLLELETAVLYKVPLITVVYNNNSWGTWTFAEGSPRSTQLHLFQENLRYDKMAEAMGAFGAYVRSGDELSSALRTAYDIAARENIPSIINVQAIKEFSSPVAYPPGPMGGSEPGIAAFTH